MTFLQYKKIMQKAYQQLKNLSERVKRIMGKQLGLFFGKHLGKRRINMEKDYNYLLHALRIETPGFITLDTADIDTLRAGEAVFLWESTLAATTEEAAVMAKSTAEKMAPEPGRVILVSVVKIIVNCDCGWDEVERIAEAMNEVFSEAGTGDMVFGAQFCDEQKGIRFVLATSEGRADTNEHKSISPALDSEPKERKNIAPAPGSEPEERKNSSPAPASEPVEDDSIDGLILAAMENDPLPIAVEIILETGQASVSMLQRRLKLGYSRAARLIDQMEQMGYVGPFEGSKPRQVLITRAKWQEIQMGGSSTLTTDGTASGDAAPWDEGDECLFL